jgi:hypothetical protein
MLQEEAIPASLRVLVSAYPLPRSTNSWILVGRIPRRHTMSGEFSAVPAS